MDISRAMRFSLSRLLSVMLLLGVILAAGMYASPMWRNVVAIGTSLLLLSSILGACYRSGRARAFWMGFAIFGWGLFGLRLAADEHVLAPRDWIMDVHVRIKRETLQERSNYIAGKRPGDWVRAGSTVARQETPEAEHFVDVARWIIHLLVALLGGCLGAAYQATQRPSREPERQKK